MTELYKSINPLDVPDRSIDKRNALTCCYEGTEDHQGRAPMRQQSRLPPEKHGIPIRKLIQRKDIFSLYLLPTRQHEALVCLHIELQVCIFALFWQPSLSSGCLLVTTVIFMEALPVFNQRSISMPVMLPPVPLTGRKALPSPNAG